MYHILYLVFKPGISLRNLFIFRTDYYVDHNKLWKILKEMGIPGCPICLLRDLYAGQEATVRTGHGTTDWFQIDRSMSKLYIVTLLI